jgi:S-methylmethionine-dependent homocysteine/selenocysteine methylase
MTHPETVLRIHRDYAAAGADILTANTFRTTVRMMRRAGVEEISAGRRRAGEPPRIATEHDAKRPAAPDGSTAPALPGAPHPRRSGDGSPSDRSESLTALAVALARKAADETAGRTVLVAGSIAPLEDCYRPDLVPPEAELREEHGLQALRLSRAGVDFILLETMGTVREAMIALAAARETGNEVVVSFLCRDRGRLYGGEPLADAVRETASLSPAMLSLNCIPVRQIAEAIDALTTVWSGPWAVYANAGRPEDLESGDITTAVGAEAYAAHAAGWLAAGARIIGGCCGTTPEHIAALRRLIPVPGGLR